MDEPRLGRVAAADNQNRRSSLIERPDRIAFWAFALAVIAIVAGTASADAGSSGGIGGGGGGGGTDADSGAAPGCSSKQFGRRTLRLGDCGQDVTTLNWILVSKQLRAPLVDDFKSPTANAVRQFQRTAKLGADGVVDSRTSRALVRSMPRQRATWYGPGFFGNETACGKTLTRRTEGVAHRTLPCGSKVVVRYRGRFVRTKVIDRGPYSNGAKWDLTQATAEALNFEYTADVRVAKIAK